jgi:hypothetical protein
VTDTRQAWPEPNWGMHCMRRCQAVVLVSRAGVLCWRRARDNAARCIVMWFSKTSTFRFGATQLLTAGILLCFVAVLWLPQSRVSPGQSMSLVKLMLVDRAPCIVRLRHGRHAVILEND